MSVISVTNINDGDAVTAASVNNQVNTIVNDYNGNITDANVSASASIGAQKLAGGTAGMFGAMQTYTPTITNLTQGNGTLVAKYIQIGKMVHVRIQFTWGSTSSGASAWVFTLPVTSVSYVAGTFLLGGASAIHSTTYYPGYVNWQSTTTFSINPIVTVSGSNPVFVTASSGFNSGSPIGFASGDIFTCNFWYEAA